MISTILLLLQGLPLVLLELFLGQYSALPPGRSSSCSWTRIFSFCCKIWNIFQKSTFSTVRLFRHLSPLLRGLGTALCIQAAIRWITSVLFWCFCLSPFCFTSCRSSVSFPSRLLFSDPVWLHLTLVGVKHLPMPALLHNEHYQNEGAGQPTISLFLHLFTFLVSLLWQLVMSAKICIFVITMFDKTGTSTKPEQVTPKGL